MILIDSNILIYSADEKYRYLRDLFKQEDVFLSIITSLEVLGYHAGWRLIHHSSFIIYNSSLHSVPQIPNCFFHIRVPGQ